MIIPTVGRVVYFRPGNGVRSRMRVLDGNQPLRADIIYVHNDVCVSLNVDDHEGGRHFMPRVVLIQDGETPPAGYSYCEWMPYQKAVAKGEIAPTLHANQLTGGGALHAAGAPHVSTKGADLDSH